MFVFKLLSCSLFFFLMVTLASSVADLGFQYNGFRDAQNLHQDGMADITPEGILRLTNTEKKNSVGHCFYSNPVQFHHNSSSSSANGNTTTAVSFSTTFVFAIVSETEISGQGLAFVIAPKRGLPGALANQFLGLFNGKNNGKPENHVFAVELDTSEDVEYDHDSNHVGININDLKSVKEKPAGYYTDENGGYKSLLLKSGRAMQVWVEYDGSQKQINVTIAPIKVNKPNVPLLSFHQDLSTILLDTMYVGFSSSTRTAQTFHYILGWSFQINGDAQGLEISSLPKLPEGKSKMLTIVLSTVMSSVVLIAICLGIFLVLRKRKFAELVEEWEHIYGTHRFTYKDLYTATKGFAEKEIIGSGAFGQVYRGVLPSSKMEVAVKKVSHDSSRGMQQFIAEIVSIGKLRHRNLVQLYGYCRRKGELLLVYEFLSCGSLEKFIFPSHSDAASSSPRAILNWTQRFKVIKGVASGLVYLHEEWEKVVIHRDVKASNVLLDSEMNPKLGDFGLAMLFDHGTGDAFTSRVAGTPGYIAPEMTRSGYASTSTDVYSFGVFLLEVACGKRPGEVKTDSTGEHLVYLVDLVLSRSRKGIILETIDPIFGNEYVAEEIDLVLKLGLLCTHTNSEFRPTMRQVMQYLNGDAALLQTDLWALEMSDTINLAFASPRAPLGDLYPYGVDGTTTGFSSTPEVSVISGTR
ncbi:L-type lectin-domain containing receptor kinase IV.1-like isoform X1 [Papaver somniferum]|uniref:L-type lectin-domain containing receptor kinase IV.1-like isoform X1 n=2 Tax=Papaver somniferum TaxID=3469 RepID=UPI000E6FEC0D|nr:L-type lectin-domain containing receptor kinase IV.1-like isoform X1 [Papaver somniferum]XP_026444393.1 L-type lectin-domain containing receptor kinase IV.1-like isoform X1 [Papaver somniferum]